uniref:Helicase ATP-binding domain-containing protein n=1 Tax=Romanomermis culicivorax TaxID=13658 RepID=A0A915J9A2_ROMCU
MSIRCVVHVEEVDGVTRRINFSEQHSLKAYISDNVDQLNEPTKIQIKELELRKYQEELCASAIEGHNVVICAPTGSGKTIVAVKIIQEHLRRRLKTSGKGKVVLLVPTVNLIDQQSNVLSTYLGNEFKICVIKGGLSGTDRQQLERFSLKIHFRSEGTTAILRITTDGNVQPNRTETSVPFGYVPSMAILPVPSKEACSKNKLPKSVLLHDNHVSVMTPQIFVNMLSNVDSDEENDPGLSESMKAKLVSVSIDDVTMMIFDECHHTDKAHAYNEIMNFYYDKKYNNKNAPLPQVIGLTASLGVGQADNLQKAIDHIIKICAHLDVKKLAIIERYQEELERHVYAPKDEIIMVPSTHENHDLSRNIIALMKVIEAEMLPILQELEDTKIKTTNEVDRKAPEKRWSSQYTCWLFGWYHYAPKIINSERKRQLLTLLEHCIIYHKSLEINALTPTNFAIEYLKYEFKILERKQTSALDKELLKLYQCK